MENPERDKCFSPVGPCQRVQLYTSFFGWQGSCNGKPRMSFMQQHHPENVYSYRSLNCSPRCFEEPPKGKTQDSAFLKIRTLEILVPPI